MKIKSKASSIFFNAQKNILEINICETLQSLPIFEFRVYIKITEFLGSETSLWKQQLQGPILKSM